MTCERCYKSTEHGEHGLGLCPLEARRQSAAVRPDSIPGGVLMYNAICNADGSPRRYDSHSEINAACALKGVMPYHEVYQESGETRIKDAMPRSTGSVNTASATGSLPRSTWSVIISTCRRQPPTATCAKRRASNGEPRSRSHGRGVFSFVPMAVLSQRNCGCVIAARIIS